MLNQYEVSITWFDKAQIQIVRMFFSLSRKGDCLRAVKKYNDSLYCLDKAFTINPKHPLTLQIKGHCLQDYKMFQEAFFCYNQVLEIETNNKMEQELKGQSISQFTTFTLQYMLLIQLFFSFTITDFIKTKSRDSQENFSTVLLTTCLSNHIQGFFSPKNYIMKKIKKKISQSDISKAKKMNSKTVTASLIQIYNLFIITQCFSYLCLFQSIITNFSSCISLFQYYINITFIFNCYQNLQVIAKRQFYN